MTKAHEETWKSEGTHVSTESGALVAEFYIPSLFSNYDEDNPRRDEARARLAAQAPAMARLLLAFREEGEITSRDGDDIRSCLLAAGVIADALK